MDERYELAELAAQVKRWRRQSTPKQAQCSFFLIQGPLDTLHKHWSGWSVSWLSHFNWLHWWWSVTAANLLIDLSCNTCSWVTFLIHEVQLAWLLMWDHAAATAHCGHCACISGLHKLAHTPGTAGSSFVPKSKKEKKKNTNNYNNNNNNTDAGSSVQGEFLRIISQILGVSKSNLLHAMAF